MIGITLKEYLESLQELAKEYPFLLDKPMLYSHDDEGNEIQTVENLPCICWLDEMRPDGRHLEIHFPDGEEAEYFPSDDCNAILIN